MWQVVVFFSKSNVDGFTENYTKLVQKRKHAHLESVGCTQIAASILWSRKISRIFLVFPLIPLLTNVKIFQPATGSLLCQRSKSNHHGLWTVDLNFEDKKNVIGAGTRKEEPLVHDCFFFLLFFIAVDVCKSTEAGSRLPFQSFILSLFTLVVCNVVSIWQILVVAACCCIMWAAYINIFWSSFQLRKIFDPCCDVSHSQANQRRTLVSFDDEHKVLVNHNDNKLGFRVEPNYKGLWHGSSFIYTANNYNFYIQRCDTLFDCKIGLWNFQVLRHSDFIVSESLGLILRQGFPSERKQHQSGVGPWDLQEPNDFWLSLLISWHPLPWIEEVWTQCHPQQW